MGSELYGSGAMIFSCALLALQCFGQVELGKDGVLD